MELSGPQIAITPVLLRPSNWRKLNFPAERKREPARAAREEASGSMSMTTWATSDVAHIERGLGAEAAAAAAAAARAAEATDGRISADGQPRGGARRRRSRPSEAAHRKYANEGPILPCSPV